MNAEYDLIIIGAGPSGIFTAYETKLNAPNTRVLMIEKGYAIENRRCPKRLTGKCANCNPCNITTGFSGSGSFSDGKLTINDHGEVGGELAQYIGLDQYRKILRYTDDLYVKFGTDQHLYGTEDEEALEDIRRKAFQANLKLIDSRVRHMGTDKAPEIYLHFQKELERMGVEMWFNTVVSDLIIENDTQNNKVATGVILQDGQRVKGKKIVAGIGREGSDWLNLMCKKYGIATRVGQIDIGCRVETDAAITAHIDSLLYEAKLVYYTKTFEDKVRTFCWNPRGEVTEEKYEGKLAVVNGHSYKSESLKTANTNFALLVSKHFTEPFNTPIEYGRYIAELGNMLSGYKVLVQRYGDLKRGRRTTTDRLRKNNIQPTLKDAVAGDLSLVLPYRLLLDVMEMLEALNHIMPGLAGDGTLLYGVEVKFYSNQLVVDKNFQTNINNLYALGDGAGLTRGLMQASMNGVCMGRILTGAW
ncbi:MAG: FAD-dependent oxidoreductase [Anaerolineae bacterium]|nr:FAD-dependent oxidoreductase [Anaerolineae bacterium]